MNCKTCRYYVPVKESPGFKNYELEAVNSGFGKCVKENLFNERNEVGFEYGKPINNDKVVVFTDSPEYYDNSNINILVGENFGCAQWKYNNEF